MTLQQIKEKVATEDGHRDWIGMIQHDSPYNIDRLWSKVNELHTSHLESENQRLKEELDKANNRIKLMLPSDCIGGYDEVKFCPIRQGDGNECKHCIND